MSGLFPEASGGSVLHNTPPGVSCVCGEDEAVTCHSLPLTPSPSNDLDKDYAASGVTEVGHSFGEMSDGFQAASEKVRGFFCL